MLVIRLERKKISNNVFLYKLIVPKTNWISQSPSKHMLHNFNTVLPVLVYGFKFVYQMKQSSTVQWSVPDT